MKRLLPGVAQSHDRLAEGGSRAGQKERGREKEEKRKRKERQKEENRSRTAVKIQRPSPGMWVTKNKTALT